MPARELMLSVIRRRFTGPILELAQAGPVPVPQSGITDIRFKATRPLMLGRAHIELHDPPPGLSVQQVSVDSSGLTFQLKADGKSLEPGYADNLIAVVYADVPTGKTNANGQQQTRRVAMGVLPAIPIEIVTQ